MERIKYTCSNCGWETSVVAQWKDLKPKRCMNKKCNTSFRKDPESLIIKDPTLNKEKAKKTSDSSSSKSSTSSKSSSSSSSYKKKEDSDDKETSYKQKTSSKDEQQQDKKKDSK